MPSKIIHVAITEDEMNLLQYLATVSDRNEPNEAHFEAKKSIQRLQQKDPKLMTRLADKISDAYYDV